MCSLCLVVKFEAQLTLTQILDLLQTLKRSLCCLISLFKYILCLVFYLILVNELSADYKKQFDEEMGRFGWRGFDEISRKAQ